MEAISREEKILSGEQLEPISREEHFLAKLAGQDVETPEPISRKEHFLQEAINNAGSGGSGGSSGGESGGSSGTPHPELPYSQFINPTWWDIKTILDNDTEDYANKAICLLTDGFDSTTLNFYNSTQKIVTSDGATYTANATHTWDKSLDKQCVSDGKNAYKTRYIIIYSNSNILLDVYANNVKDFALSLIYYEFVGNVQMTGVQHNFSALKIIPNFNDTGNLAFSHSSATDGNDFPYYRSAYSLEYIPPIDASRLNYKSEYMFGFYINSTSSSYQWVVPPKVKTYEFYNKVPDISLKYAFYNNFYVEQILNLDLENVSDYSNAFVGCRNLKNLKLLNIKKSLNIGTYVIYGHLLTVDSLINTIKELIDTGSSLTLTIGSNNLTKLANTYVKLVTDDNSGKLPFEVCESTDEGAMLIKDYVTLKHWTLA